MLLLVMIPLTSDSTVVLTPSVIVMLFFIHFNVAAGKHGLVEHFNTVGTPGVIDEGLVDMVVLFKGTENVNI